MHIDFHFDIVAILVLLITEVLTIPIPDIDNTDGVLVRTVPWGTTVILKCMSNDNDHNFQYWTHVNKGTIIGPANPYDPAKYRFEILSGNLIVKEVSKQEEGLYECVSRAVNGEDMNIRLVRMIVQNDWEDIYEHDYNINLIRVLIVAITLVLVSMVAWFGYRMWKDRYRFPSYLQTEDDDDDESTEELFSHPSTSKSSGNNIVTTNLKSPITERSFDDVDISTDFNSIMENVTGK